MLPAHPTCRSLGHCHQQRSCSAIYQRGEELATGPSLLALAVLAAPPKQEEAELRESVRAHLVRLVQVLQVQVLNEVIHHVQVIVLSCEVESIHSFLKRGEVRMKACVLQNPRIPVPAPVT